MKKGEFDKAIEDCTEAIQIDPQNASAYNNRASAWNKKGEFDKAINDCTEAIRIDPEKAYAYKNRGNAWAKKGEFDKAIKDYNEAIRIDPKFAVAYDRLAWLFATATDSQLRNGNEAVKNAKLACELTDWKDGNQIGTLAAAYAEAQDFDNAIKWLEKAFEIDGESETRFKMLELFHENKPYRD